MKPYDIRTTVTSPGASSKPSQPLRRTISEDHSRGQEGYHDEHDREHRADQPSHVRPRPLCARQQVSHRRRAPMAAATRQDAARVEFGRNPFERRDARRADTR